MAGIEGISRELFWDLDNIAFSHFRCNARASRYVPKDKRQENLLGQIKCTKCKNYLNKEQFSIGMKGGFQSECVSCRSLSRRRAREV